MSFTAAPDRSVALLRALADRIDANDPGACNNLGVLYYSKGLHTEAVKAFLRALALAPRMRVAARNLEVAAAHPGACDDATLALEQRLQTDPHESQARRELARLCRLLARPADARAHLEVLLEADPDDAVALREYGLLEQAGGDLRKAQRWFERALAVAADDTWARLHLAEVHYHRGGNEQALRELDELLACDASVADAHLLRSFVLGDLGYQEAATEASRRANALDPALATLQPDLSLDPRLAPTAGAPPGSVPAIPITRGLLETPAIAGIISNESLARYSLGLAFRQRGYFAEARREFERADAQGEDPLLVQHALAELDLVQGQHGAARQRYDALLAERGEDARLWNERGVALHQGGDVSGAADSYRRALRADPRHALAYNNLGVALADLGEGVPSREALQRATQLDPTLVRARLNLSRWHLRQRDPLTALTVLRELVAFHPTLADAWHEMGLALLALDRTDEARQAVATAIDHRPDFAEARYTLAEVLGTLGDHDGALRETQHALGLAPVRVDPRLTVGIALHTECPESVGRLDLLTVCESEPLVGAEFADADVASLLPEREAPHAHETVNLLEHIESLAAALRAGDALLSGALSVSAASNGEHVCGLLSRGAPEEAQRIAHEVLTQCTGAVRAEAPWIEAWAMQLAGDAFAATGVHGEAYERYAQVRGLLTTAQEWARATPALEIGRRALRGEVRAACLLGRGGEAVPLLDRFAAADAYDPEVLALLAAAHAAAGDAHGARVARAAVLRLLRLEPRSAALLHFAGDAALRLDDPALALVLYRRALTLDPTRPSPRLAIARLLQARGDVLAAHLELVAALAAVPTWREARLALAALHLQAERASEAVRLLAGLLAQVPTDTEALAALADALRTAGRDTDARTAVQRARRLDPDQPHALWVDGQLLADQGRMRDARARWGRIGVVAAGSPWARLAREALASLDHAMGSDAVGDATPFAFTKGARGPR
jgi:cellulose synthase operon protein C